MSSDTSLDSLASELANYLSLRFPQETAKLRQDRQATAIRNQTLADSCKFLPHCWLKDRTRGEWLPFLPWPAQQDVLSLLPTHPRLCVLKARQLGLTWLVLAYALHRMIRDAITVLLFSQRDEEAKDLAARLSGMIERLPAWLAPAVQSSSTHALKLSNGAEALSFPTTAGRSYTAGLVLVDEADHVPDLEKLLNAVAPTVGDGGQLILLSSPDKSQPESLFKRIYRAARAGSNDYHPLFLGWQARPGRSPAWYAEQSRAILAQTGALDDLHQEYPATEAEALAPRSLDKRIAPAWLAQCYDEQLPILTTGAPALPGLVVFVASEAGHQYAIGMDPAEGNPTSDDSALAVVDVATGEECATLAGHFEPGVFAAYGARLAEWYNGAGVLVERNNHGHAVLLWFHDNGGPWVISGYDGKPGWLSNTKGKALLYDRCAEAFRDGQTLLHSLATFTQLASIEGSSLRAPKDQHDDRADAHALALQAALLSPSIGPGAIGMRPADPHRVLNPLASLPAGLRGDLRRKSQ